MTYSIVARHPDTGELGVAVQSHYFAVGPVVPWAAPGVGAVATQAAAEIAHGPRGLELLGEGLPAAAALETLLAADEGREHRQVAIVDADSNAAAHTGAHCIPAAGHITGAGVSCQANIMATPEIWPAMLSAYATVLARDGTLAEALLDALDAAEALGGDLRGRQSAAIVVVPASGEPWQRVLDLRVEDHPEPLAELRRLHGVHGAYQIASQADARIAAGDAAGAGALLGRALELAPDNHELRFWYGLHLADSGELERGTELVSAAITVQPGWRTLLPRLSEMVAPGAAAVTAALKLQGHPAG